MSEVFRYAGHPTTISLFYNAIFWLCLLVAANGLLLRFVPKAAFNQAELLTAYLLVQLTSGLTGHDSAEVLLPILVHATKYQNAANGWADILLPNLPSWLVVKDTAAAEAFYIGHTSLYQPTNLRAWALPIFAWVGFMGTLAGVMLCLNVLLRKQWTERERLPFPLVYLPLEMTAPETPLYRNKMLWFGFIAAAGLQLWNGLAVLNPAIPPITVKYTDMGTNITQRPWSAIGWLPVSFYPFAIALGMLLPTDFLFSSWFFFWFWKGQSVVSAAMAWDAIPNFPFVSAQSLGGYLAVALTSLWTGRRHFANLMRQFWEWKTPDDPEEEEGSPLSYRAAMIGVLAGLSLIILFCLLAGMQLWVALLALTIYLGIAVAITRMRAELGPPVHDLHHAGPDTIIPELLGPTNLDKHSLAVFGTFWGFNRAYRTHAMPIQLEGFRMGQQAQIPPRFLFRILLIAGFVGPLVAFWTLLHLGYRDGAASGAIGPPNVLTIFGGEAWNRYTNQVRVPQPPQVGEGMALLGGLVFSLCLSALRLRVVGFPFHPVGYAIASSWGMSILWVPMLLAWLAKIVLLRYGGLGLYRKALPLCYGVILGECVAGSIWSLLGVFAGIPTYAFWP